MQKYSFVISIVHWLTELSDLKFYRIKQLFISIDFVTKYLRSPAPKEITNTKFLHTAPISLNMKVMAIGIHQPGGILYVFDITTFLKVIWQLNVESNPRQQWFCFSFLCDWFRKVKLLTQPIRSKGKTNHVLVVLVFPRFRLFVRLYLEFWLLRVSSFLVIGRFNNTQSKSALINNSRIFDRL